MIRSLTIALLTFILFALFLSACAANSQAIPSTEIVNVVETVPVEVTRLVEVPQTVEVTRMVIQTAIVEVVVTETPTATPNNPTAAVTWVYAPSDTPLYAAPTNLVKQKGTSLIKITNQTNDVLKVELFGEDPLQVDIDPGKSVFHVLREGKYTYKVQRDNKRLYSGSISINNPDKHELILHENKATVILP